MTPKETNALIRELKKNREDMLPKCKLKIANRYDNLSRVLGADVDCLSPSGNHWDTCVSGTYEGVIYSLPPDFPEVPEVTEGWVVVPVDNKGFVSIDDFDLWWGEMATLVLNKYKVTHFGGYIFRSLVSGADRLSTLLLGFDKNNNLSVHCELWAKPAIPVALRFWSTDVDYACTLGFKPWNADES